MINLWDYESGSKTNDRPESDTLNIKLSVEVLSFAVDMLKDSEWSKISAQGVKNQKLMVSWLNLLRREQKALPTEIIDIWSVEKRSLSSKVREKIAVLFDERTRNKKEEFPFSLIDLLQDCVREQSDVAALTTT